MIIGIDLGTTNSLVAYWQDGQARLIPNSQGRVMTPSVVGLGDDNEIIVGDAALGRLITHPHLTTAAFKRYMGTNHDICLGKKVFRMEELSALVLQSLKTDAEAFLGESIEEAIITVPAYFNDTQRKATRIAGELAGLRVERLLNEPTAAALAYGLHQRDSESCFLVFDLGGGTFDVSILELFEGIMEVHASAGDNFLGGEDFLNAIVKHFIDNTDLKELTRADRLNREEMNRLRNEAEKAKLTLTGNVEATMYFDYKGKNLECVINRNEFDQMTDHLIQRIRTPVERSLRDARIVTEDIDEIVLVGGASRMPAIQGLVTRMFQRFPVRTINPDEVVAMGAAVQAGLKARNADLKDVVITDVCPYTLGIETVNEIRPGVFSKPSYHPIIERNTVIPVSKVDKFYTLKDGQSKINVKIYQGESHSLSENIFLGKLMVDVPSKPAGEETVDVRFTYDINGLLEVDVTVLSTGKTKTLLIEENPGVLSQEEIKASLKKLAALKVHPKDQVENKEVLARAGILFQEALGEVRAEIGYNLDLFKAILEGQDPKEIRSARHTLKQFLEHLER